MIDKKTIEHIAKLARLKITEEEVLEYSKQLERVIENFQKISMINTSGVEPLVTPTEIELYLRDDVVDQKFSPTEIIENAPSRSGNLFKVPPVV